MRLLSNISKDMYQTPGIDKEAETLIELLQPEKFMNSSHDTYMQLAVREAEAALDEGEVPVGAVIVTEGRILGRAHNQVERLNDATAHAEMIALTQASAALQDWRLEGCTLYVTLEPCAMCAGALVHSRVPLVVFGTRDWQQGGLLSNFGIAQFAKHTHRIEVIEGIAEAPCREVLRRFFDTLRTKPNR